jgi:Zn-dependent protease with chaperone function
MNRIQRYLSALVLAFSLPFTAGLPVSAQSNSSGSKPARTTVYDQAKATLPDDLYPAYRLLDRIMSANPSVRQRVSISIRSIDDSWCRQVLGQTTLCDVASQLPDLQRADNLFLWALQVAGAAQADPNAYASSKNNRIVLNRSLDDAFAGNLDAKACVIAHELAHIDKDHTKTSKAAMVEWNNQAAARILSAVNNAKKAQRSSDFWTAVSMVANAASAGLNASAGNYSLASLSQMNNEMLATSHALEAASGNQMVARVLNAAQQEAPQVYQALGQMQGLSGRIVRRTMKDVNIYLGDVRTKAADLSRQHEYEADALAAGYLANSGINPRGCLDMVTLLHRGESRPFAARLDTHPGETERRTKLEAMVASLDSVYRQANGRSLKPSPLAFGYEDRNEVVTLFPVGMAPATGNGRATVDRFLADPDAARRDGPSRVTRARNRQRSQPVQPSPSAGTVNAAAQTQPALPYQAQMQQISEEYRKLNEWQQRRSR